MRLVTVKLSEEDIKKIEEIDKNGSHYPSWFIRAAIRQYIKEFEEGCPKSSLKRESNSK